jgi:ribosomal protein S18 acetylase RimI-like enzyme
MIEILQLTEATQAAADDLAHLGSLLHEDKRTMRVDELTEIVQDKNIALVVLRDETRIVGMATLYVIPKVGKQNGLIEDVIVDETYRGQGLGEKLTARLISIAREKDLSSISLTSNPKRTAAHKLYEKLGFVKKETDVFKLAL